MSLKVDVEFSTKHVSQSVKRGDLIVVVDVLRSCSSIANALANGASAVIPVETLREAYQLRKGHRDYLLAGERRGHRLKGFDMGNSPLEFTRERVEGRVVVLTTTSGTATLVRCRSAAYVLVGAFLNTTAVANKAMELAKKKGMSVSFVLAGEKGLFSLEDFLCAGAIAYRLSFDGLELSDKTLAAVFAFEQVKGSLYEHVVKSKHAKHLVDLGFEKDVVFSCGLDRFGIVPVYQRGSVTSMR